MIRRKCGIKYTCTYWNILKSLDMFFNTKMTINFQTTSVIPLQVNILHYKYSLVFPYKQEVFFSVTFSMTNISVIYLAYTYDMSQQWQGRVNKNVQYTSLTSAQANRMFKQHYHHGKNIYPDHGIKVEEKKNKKINTFTNINWS